VFSLVEMEVSEMTGVAAATEARRAVAKAKEKRMVRSEGDFGNKWV
jgi:hypothetical protein